MQSFNMVMIYRQKTQKRLPVLEDDIIIIKKINLVSLAQRMHFLQNLL